jgi:hypothetical protein
MQTLEYLTFAADCLAAVLAAATRHYSWLSWP